MDDIQFTTHLHASDAPEVVEAPAVRYVSVRGTGAPGSNDFYRKKRLIAALARHVSEEEVEPAVELQYWYPEGSATVGIADFYSKNPLSSLQYRVMASIERDLTSAELAEEISGFDHEDMRSGDMIESYSTPAHLVVQVMHHGPFAEELQTLGRLDDFARSQALSPNGPHLEIHLDAFEPGTDQSALRTILRDGVSRN